MNSKTSTNINNVTVSRILNKCNSNALGIYTFLYKCADRQKTNVVKATNSFIMHGCKIGKQSLARNKKLLEEHGFIKSVRRRDRNGKFKGHYVQVNYWKNNHKPDIHRVDSPLVDKPDGGFSATNAYNKNINACDEKLNACKEETNVSSNPNPKHSPHEGGEYVYSVYTGEEEKQAQKILDYWNNLFKDVPATGGHNGLTSAVEVDSTGKLWSVYELIMDTLQQISWSELRTAMNNYYKVITQDKYEYKYRYKNLGRFLYSGLYRKTGFVSFLDSNDPLTKFKDKKDPLGFIRNDFKPVTVTYDPKNPYNKPAHTYYGFPVEDFDYIDEHIVTLISTLTVYENRGKVIKRYHLIDLEKCIAALLWKRNKDKYHRSASLNALWSHWQRWHKIHHELEV